VLVNRSRLQKPANARALVRRKAPRIEQPASLTGGRSRRSLVPGVQHGWVPGATGVSEAVSLALGAAENAALEERCSRLRERSRRYGQCATLSRREESSSGASWANRSDARTRAVREARPKREERRQAQLSPPPRDGGSRTVQIGCSWGRSIFAHVGEMHLVRRDWRAPRGAHRSGGLAERRAPAGGRRREGSCP